MTPVYICDAVRTPFGGLARLLAVGPTNRGKIAELAIARADQGWGTGVLAARLAGLPAGPAEAHAGSALAAAVQATVAAVSQGVQLDAAQLNSRRTPYLRLNGAQLQLWLGDDRGHWVVLPS